MKWICIILAAVLMWVSSPAAPAEGVRDGSLADPNLRFIGRWDRTDPTVAQGQWVGAYIRMSFTGSTVKVRLGTDVWLQASFDGQPFREFRAKKGWGDLTPEPLTAGEHTLLLVPSREADRLHFQGFELDSQARTVPVPERPIIEFIGDSITLGAANHPKFEDNRVVNAYSWQACALLDADCILIAKSGIPLVGDGGMEMNYRMDNPPGGKETKAWKPTYTPSLVVINLGANDWRGDFVGSYVRLVEQIRTNYPQVRIVGMRPFGGQYGSEPKKAFAKLEGTHATGLHYVDTTGWLEQPADFLDGVHLTKDGARKAGEKLKAAIEPLMPGEATAETLPH